DHKTANPTAGNRTCSGSHWGSRTPFPCKLFIRSDIGQALGRGTDSINSANAATISRLTRRGRHTACRPERVCSLQRFSAALTYWSQISWHRAQRSGPRRYLRHLLSAPQDSFHAAPSATPDALFLPSLSQQLPRVALFETRLTSTAS